MSRRSDLQALLSKVEPKVQIEDLREYCEGAFVPHSRKIYASRTAPGLKLTLGEVADEWEKNQKPGETYFDWLPESTSRRVARWVGWLRWRIDHPDHTNLNVGGIS